MKPKKIFVTWAPEPEACLENLSSSRNREGMSFSGNKTRFIFLNEYDQRDHRGWLNFIIQN